MSNIISKLLLELEVGQTIIVDWNTNLFVDSGDRAWLCDDPNGEGLRVKLPSKVWKCFEAELTCCFGMGLVYADPVHVRALIEQGTNGLAVVEVFDVNIRK